ncbi:MAG TPA: hypothetical protein VEW68_02910, partial [Patescibacteria group bacterium]|nr:hypothetical protein [Patescibacteria group bacterium]
MELVRRALEAELLAEQEFVAVARASEKAPKGWPAALVMYHFSMWRELLRNALHDLSEGRPYSPPPPRPDDYNDTELANGIGTPLTDAAARSENLLSEIIKLYTALGEREFEWYTSKTTSEAVLRNSYLHPRLHMYQYLRQNGNVEAALKIFEDEAAEMRTVAAPPIILGVALYNLAVVRAAQERIGEAIELLEEAF